MPVSVASSVPVLEQLAAAPERLAAVTGARVDVRPAPDEWSAGEVLAHLRACGHVWGGCIRRVLTEDVPTIRAVSPRTWITASGFAAQGWSEHLAAFTADRAALLEVLRPLAPADWERSARVIGAGRPVVRTVLSYAERLAVHERSHLRQVERAVSAAGPSASIGDRGAPRGCGRPQVMMFERVFEYDEAWLSGMV